MHLPPSKYPNQKRVRRNIHHIRNQYFWNDYIHIYLVFLYNWRVYSDPLEVNNQFQFSVPLEANPTNNRRPAPFRLKNDCQKPYFLKRLRVFFVPLEESFPIFSTINSSLLQIEWPASFSSSRYRMRNQYFCNEWNFQAFSMHQMNKI